jgi:hypothetical protein
MSERIQLMPVGDDKLFLPPPQAIGLFHFSKNSSPDNASSVFTNRQSFSVQQNNF